MVECTEAPVGLFVSQMSFLAFAEILSFKRKLKQETMLYGNTLMTI